MPRFPVSFGKRKSTAYKDDADAHVSSFRVLERTEVAGVKPFDGHAAMGRAVTTVRPYSRTDSLHEDDNMFAGLKVNRESGSSNTTKTASTDTSSRHSAVSTAPSSATPAADFAQQQQQLNDETSASKRPYADIPIPPVPKSNSGFFNRAGRTFSFGSSKKSAASDEAPPPVPAHGPGPNVATSRARGMTSSTVSTATPPKVDDEGYGGLDLGGDFGTMFNGFDKRASVATLRDKAAKGQHPRSLTGNLVPQQQQERNTANTKPPISPHSINSEHSNDGLLTTSPHEQSTQGLRYGAAYPPRSNRPSDIIEDEDANLLKDSLAASKYLGGGATGGQSGRLRRNEDPRPSSSWQSADNGREDDNLFDNSFLSSSRVASRYVSRPPSPPRNRVMTPAQFERYKQEKERTTAQGAEEASGAKAADDDEDEENYEDDEDEMEKSRQAAKQRKKQEAHMTVYRQQMMKVTGDSVSPLPRPPLATVATAPPAMATKSDSSEDDEEVPLAILAAHGFPNRNRPPTRLNTAASNPNLRASMLGPPQSVSASPVVGPGTRASHLPAFARNLPQDPFVGAGLIRNSARESIAMGGGSPAAPPQPPLPPGGLVGVIAQEERSRAMRRGSPHIDNKLISQVNGTPGQAFDPIAGIPPQMMYGMNGSPSMQQMQQMQQMMGQMGYPQSPQSMLTPGDQAQIQMTQQMQQFMQMQMQFMQMMAGNQGSARPNSFVAPSAMGDMSSRHSFVGGDYPPEPRPRPVMDNRMRTMSMVQPSSASWIQPLGGYAPSIRVQGDGYAPSIAPSERSNVGLPGRYRPVSQMPIDPVRRVSTMSGALNAWDEPEKLRTTPSPVPRKSGSHSDDDDDEEGWAAMKAKREKKKSLWKSKKGLSGLLS